MKYVAPKSGLAAYTCPHCGVLASQHHTYNCGDLTGGSYADIARNPVRVSKCGHCKEICLWHFDKMVYPIRGNAPSPNPDMPEDVKKDYEEAASIYTQSPRGAAALLRLAVQKLCKDLGGEGNNINEDIKALVQRGLPTQVQQSLDVVRVVGNNAVHPGQIETDNSEVAGHLFVLLNIITDYMISMPTRVQSIYNGLPAPALDAIAKRDNKV